MTIDPLSTTGGCQCGAVRYQAEGPFRSTNYCHCRMCQKAHGAPFGTFAAVARAGFHITQGEPKGYRSSIDATRRFCADCGTPLIFDDARDPELIDLTTGGLDRPEDAAPIKHTGIESQLPWIAIADDLPRRPTTGDPTPATRPDRPQGGAASGGCVCGALRFVVAATPEAAHWCHCSMCRRAFGTAAATFASVYEDALTWIGGEPRRYRSSAFALRGFCPDCGTPLTFQLDDSPSLGLALGAFDRPDLLAPSRHCGVESQLPWLIFSDGLPRERTEDDPDFHTARDAAG